MSMLVGSFPVTAVFQGSRLVWPYRDTGDAQFEYAGVQTETEASFLIGSDLIVEQSDWGISVHIPSGQLVSASDENITIEA